MNTATQPGERNEQHPHENLADKPFESRHHARGAQAAQSQSQANPGQSQQIV